MNSTPPLSRRRYYPLLSQPVPAGFPSLATDYTEARLCLDELLIENEEATFFAQVKGISMTDHGIHDGDYVIVNRALPALDENIVVAAIDGAMVLKQLRQMRGGILLRSGNAGSSDIWVGPEQELMVWGVVRWSLHRV